MRPEGTRGLPQRVTIKIIVKGRVQGVSFRASLRERADRRRVEGWVRNRTDGSVEALLQGFAEDVRDVADWATVGPPLSKVSEVEEEPLGSYPRQVGFRIVA
jgi:acylphosphatase